MKEPWKKDLESFSSLFYRVAQVIEAPAPPQGDHMKCQLVQKQGIKGSNLKGIINFQLELKTTL